MDAVHLHLVGTFDSNMEYGFTIGCTSDSQVLLRGPESSNPKDFRIKLFDCESQWQISEWSSQCCHEFCPIVGMSLGQNKTNCIVESCHRCSRITLYDPVSKDHTVVLDNKSLMPGKVISIHNSSVIVMSDLSSDSLVELKWNGIQDSFSPASWKLNLDLGVITGMACLEELNLLVLVAFEKRLVKAVHYPSGELKWEIKGETLGRKLWPRGVCCDAKGLVYIADYHNKRIVVAEGQTGRVKQALLTEKYGVVYDVGWNHLQPHLIVKHGQERQKKISFFNVQY